ncbi:unnamed protein product [Coffea canephora]|uniref:Uncharacterized protein n=1 Tax=Coffea canephora TaxID=49390 RepID=A0A068UJZ3_COFCA|nr:unnamed protein product [Coffea canephora]
MQSFSLPPPLQPPPSCPSASVQKSHNCLLSNYQPSFVHCCCYGY